MQYLPFRCGFVQIVSSCGPAWWTYTSYEQKLMETSWT